MHLETDSLRRNTCHALMVFYVKTRKKMQKTRQNGGDLEPCPSIEIQCEVLDLSTKRLPSTNPNSSSSFNPSSCPSSPPNKRRHLSPSVNCSAQESIQVHGSLYSTPHSVTTISTETPLLSRTIRTTTGAGAETTYSGVVQSKSPDGRTSSDDLRQQTNDDCRFVSRHIQYSPFSFAHQSHGIISPVTYQQQQQQPPQQQFEMRPAIGTFPFNAAANPFMRGFPGLGQALLTDTGPSLPLQGSVHPHTDFASAAAAFPSSLQRRRRRGQRCSVIEDPTCSPHLSQHPSGCSPRLSRHPSGLHQYSTEPRPTDDDCSGESANGRGLGSSSRNSERSHSEEKDPAYLERRRKNNEAAKRSRDARRQKEEEIATRAATLEQENITLKAELLLLRRESAELHGLLYGRVDTHR